MYTFQPLTEEEIDAYSLMPKGEYDFQVVKAERQTSKTGKPMAKLQLLVWDKEGKDHVVFDYLVFSTVPLNLRKVKHFCEATQQAEAYANGQLPEDLARLCGRALVDIDEGAEIPEDKLNGKPKGSKYPTKNIVVDYLPPKAKAQVDFNDTIPF